MAITTVSSHVVSVNAIQGTLIADNAITAVHIATNAVSGTLIADNAITAVHVAQNSITVTQLADDCVESDKIADGVITTNHLNKAMISSQTEVTPVAGDFVLLGDTSDSNNLKKAPLTLLLNSNVDLSTKLNLSGGTMTGTLNITQSSTADTIKLTRGDVNQNNMIKFRSSSADKWIVGQRNDSTEHFRFYSYGTSSDVLSILTDGKVGIGTASPSNALSVSGVITSGNFTAAGVGGTPGDANTAEIGPGYINLARDDTATAKQILFGKNGAVHSFLETTSSGLNIGGGNVGIGTASPEERLHILGQAVFDNIGNTNRGNIIMGAHGSGTSKWATLAATHYNEATGSGNGSGNAGVMVIGSESASSYNKIWIGHGPYELNPATQINFGTHSATTHNLGGTTHMVIDSAGAVGIGTTSPASKLHIRTSTNNNYEFEEVSGELRFSALNDARSANVPLQFAASEFNFISGKVGIGITNPLQNLVVGTTTNYDPPGLGNTNANFAILKNDGSSSGDYGIITGISSDGNVWSQVQRTDGTATSYNYYLQPSGGSVGVGVPQNYTYLPNLTSALHVAKTRSGTGNVTDYLAKLSLEALGYAGSNYQLAAIDFNGGDTAGAHNGYARIGCSSMNGANNQESGSLEFYVKDPSYNLSGYAAAMKICGKAGTQIAGAGQHRNGVLFPFMGIALDRTWANYPGIAVGNSSDYSTTASANAEFRVHGANFSSASYPGTSGADFSVDFRIDGAYQTGSDRRRKKNITTIDNALSTVKQLTGKKFQIVNRVDEVQETTSKNGYKFGFIAQEVENIIPETIKYNADEDDGTENWNSAYSLDYSSLTALLVNAIKEQDTVIQDLKSRIETLEG